MRPELLPTLDIKKHFAKQNATQTFPKSLDHPIPGEKFLYRDSLRIGEIKLSNYRLIISSSKSHYIPCGSIETVERNLTLLKIYCKDVKSYKVEFNDEEKCIDWEEKLRVCSKAAISQQKLFASMFYEAVQSEMPDLFEILTRAGNSDVSYQEYMEKKFYQELKRLGFKENLLWRVTHLNKYYELCDTYPRYLIVPQSFDDIDISDVANYRGHGRIPTAVWRHKNGAILARASQPTIGFFGSGREQDERLTRALSDACSLDSPTGQTDQKLHRKDLLIIDARSATAAYFNRIKGGGDETNYKNVEVVHMNIPNVHGVVKTYRDLRAVLYNERPEERPKINRIDETGYTSALSSIMKAAKKCANTLSNERRAVLVHCSDGWDRTPQITSLTQIILDPHYRTIKGFETLIEREWIEFGHKFDERNVMVIQSNGSNEQCPIFLQFLECVYKLTTYYPMEFEFNNVFLMKLAQHVYSNLFGDFIFGNSKQRTYSPVKYFSIWSLFKLNHKKYINMFYKPSIEELVIDPDSISLYVWEDYYLSPTRENPLKKVSMCEEKQKKKQSLRNAKSCDKLFLFNREVENGYVIVQTDEISPPHKYPSLPNLSFEFAQCSSSCNGKAESSNNSKDSNFKLNISTENGFTHHEETNGINGHQDYSNFDGLDTPMDSNFRTIAENVYKNLESEIKGLQIKVQNLEASNRRYAQNSSAQQHQSSYNSLGAEIGIPAVELDGTASDTSWENIDNNVEGPTSWIPDHSVHCCMECHCEFWVMKRKHHCRNCGKIFCDRCSHNSARIPRENLHRPSRVCIRCFSSFQPDQESRLVAVSSG